MELILASTSPYRRALVERLGLPFRVEAPLIDENELKQSELSPMQLAEALAQRKAESVWLREPDAVVIGSDQLVEFQGRVLGKPGTVEAAVDQLEILSGARHTLITALVVASKGGVQCHTDLTRLKLRKLERSEIVRYVAQDQPLDCAGAYKLESQGIALVERIESDDHTAIIGLPMIALCSFLRALGIALP